MRFHPLYSMLVSSLVLFSLIFFAKESRAAQNRCGILGQLTQLTSDHAQKLNDQIGISLATIRQKFPNIVELTVKTKDSRADREYVNTVSIQASGQGQAFIGTLARMDYVIANGALDARIDVQGPYQESGLSRVLLLHALANHRHIRRLPVSLEGINLAQFMASVVTEGPMNDIRSLADRIRDDGAFFTQVEALFADEVRQLRTKRSVQIYRQRLIRSLMEYTPAGRVRVSLGFGKLTDITINLAKNDGVYVTGEFQPGSPVPESDVRVRISDASASVDKRLIELLPNGEILRLAAYPLP